MRISSNYSPKSSVGVFMLCFPIANLGKFCNYKDINFSCQHFSLKFSHEYTVDDSATLYFEGHYSVPLPINMYWISYMLIWNDTQSLLYGIINYSFCLRQVAIILSDAVPVSSINIITQSLWNFNGMHGGKRDCGRNRLHKTRTAHFLWVGLPNSSIFSWSSSV